MVVLWNVRVQRYYLSSLSAMKRYHLYFPLVLALFLSSLYVFRNALRSTLRTRDPAALRAADGLTLSFSRTVYGFVHMTFIYCYWHLYQHSTNILALNVVLWINAAYHVQDAVANAVFRRPQSVAEGTASFLRLTASLAFCTMDSPVPPSMGAWVPLVKPTVLLLLITSVFVQTLVSARRVIGALGDFSPWLKGAIWAVLLVVFVPLSFAGVLAPALESVGESWVRFLQPKPVRASAGFGANGQPPPPQQQPQRPGGPNGFASGGPEQPPSGPGGPMGGAPHRRPRPAGDGADPTPGTGPRPMPAGRGIPGRPDPNAPPGRMGNPPQFPGEPPQGATHDVPGRGPLGEAARARPERPPMRHRPGGPPE